MDILTRSLKFLSASTSLPYLMLHGKQAEQKDLTGRQTTEALVDGCREIHKIGVTLDDAEISCSKVEFKLSNYT